jgi:hypothetical protein
MGIGFGVLAVKMARGRAFVPTFPTASGTRVGFVVAIAIGAEVGRKVAT